MGDFAENYTFSIQDEIQSYHWHKQYCTLHPIVLYYKEKGQLVGKSFCFLSDDLNYDTCFVYKVQTDLVNAVKKELQQLKKFEYFSDGCAGQSKNLKIGLTLHSMKQILESKQNGSFLPQVMGSLHVMALEEP